MRTACLPLVAASLLAAGGHAYEVITSAAGQPVKWATGKTSYVINTNGGPDEAANAIWQAMATWTGAGPHFRFNDDGASTAGVNANDGLNTGCFGALGSNGILAQNRMTFRSQTGHMIDSDILFNTSYDWTTDLTPDTYDVANIATHEWGHSLALADLYDDADSEKTMYGYGDTDETKKRTLDPDDVDGLAFLYPQPGSLRVNIQPADAVAAGAQWRIDTGDWLDGGAALSVTPGLYPVTFREAEGYGTPTGQTVTIVSGQPVTLTATYPSQSGSLRVTLQPQGAVDSGARWRVDGGAWQDSGSLVSGLAPGAHPVSFSTVAGYQSPEPFLVTIRGREVAAAEGVYTVTPSGGRGEISLQKTTCRAVEGKRLSIIVRRLNGSNGEVSVNYLTKPKNASPWTDYGPRSGRLVWANGDASPKTVKIPITPDGENEGEERFLFILKNVLGGAELLPQSKARIVIASNAKAGPPASGTAVPPMAALGNALGGEGLTWFTSPGQPWREDGTAAAAASRGGPASWLQAEVEGPGLLAFAWSLDPGAADGYVLLVDGKAAARRPPAAGWADERIRLAAGWHTLRWVFAGDETKTGTARLARVSWTED